MASLLGNQHTSTNRLERYLPVDPDLGSVCIRLCGLCVPRSIDFLCLLVCLHVNMKESVCAWVFFSSVLVRSLKFCSKTLQKDDFIIKVERFEMSTARTISCQKHIFLFFVVFTCLFWNLHSKITHQATELCSKNVKKFTFLRRV